MGPWLDICAQCGARHHRKVSDMLLPEVICDRCGTVKINAPETIAKTTELLARNNWYAGFVDLLFSMEERLGIEYEDADFPHPLITAKQLVTVTVSRCGTAVTPTETLQLIEEFTGKVISDPDAPLEL